jgi:hypothetical protein
MSATFHISAGNITGAGDVVIDTNVFKVDATANRVGIGTASPSTPLEVSGILTISGITAGAQALALNDTKITGLATPTSGADAANKAYVDSVATGLNIHTAARLATIAALPAYTPAGAGVGKTLTGSATGVLTVDGITVALNDRVLVKNEGGGSSTHNGVYKCTTAGDVGVAYVLTRATDFDGSPSSEVIDGSFLFIGQGSLAGTGWVQIANDPITVDTDALEFAQFNSQTAYVAGAGLTLSGSTFNVGAHADGSITVNANDIQVGILATDAQHGVRGGGTQHALAIAAGAAGFLSGADKTKLDNTSGTNSGDITLTASGSTANANGASLSGQALTLQPASASFAGLLSAAGFTTLSNQSGTNTGDVTLAAIGATPNANGASLSGQALNLQPASASFGGVVTTGAQTLAGAKTFNDAMVLVSNLTVDTDTLVVNATTNRVGIATAAPTVALDVTGDIKTSAVMWFATRQHAYAASFPVAGAHVVGDIVYNTAPVLGGSLGWVCTTAGTPGVFAEFGLISTDAAV